MMNKGEAPWVLLLLLFSLIPGGRNSERFARAFRLEAGARLCRAGSVPEGSSRGAEFLPISPQARDEGL